MGLEFVMLLETIYEFKKCVLHPRMLESLTLMQAVGWIYYIV